jgi:hypothetical protein
MTDGTQKDGGFKTGTVTCRVSGTLSDWIFRSQSKELCFESSMAARSSGVCRVRARLGNSPRCFSRDLLRHMSCAAPCSCFGLLLHI